VTTSAPTFDEPLGAAADLDRRARSAVPTSALFDASYRLHRDDVYRLCLRYGAGRPAWAEDVTHDVFLKLLEHLPELSDPESCGGWLYRVAANLAVSRLRREQSWVGKLRTFLAADEPDERSASDLFEEREEAAAVMRTLDELPARERVVLCMKVLDGKSQKEIAEALALSEGYVSKLCARAWARVQGVGWSVSDDGAAAAEEVADGA
jgi:RNA polymerase sigma-70 factor (ECF subfamily)